MATEIDLVKYGVLWQKVESMESKIDKMEIHLESLVELANKSKGGLWIGMMLVSTISSIIGYLTHLWSK